LYDAIKQFTKPESVRLKEADETLEYRRLIPELACVSEESDILKKATRTSQEMPSEVRIYHSPQASILYLIYVPCFDISS
jgi:transposase-like protein